MAEASRTLAELRSEIERTRWLSTRNVRVPDILDLFDDDRLGVALMTALPGAHPHESAQPPPTCSAPGARAAHAHAVASADCPFDETTAARLARARAMIAAGRVDPDEFDDRNLGGSPLEIYERLAADAPRITEDIVLVHGDATFDNLLIDRDGNLGFIDCGHAGRGDRTLDLEAVTSDIEGHSARNGSNTSPAVTAPRSIQPSCASLTTFTNCFERPASPVRVRPISTAMALCAIAVATPNVLLSSGSDSDPGIHVGEDPGSMTILGHASPLEKMITSTVGTRCIAVKVCPNEPIRPLNRKSWWCRSGRLRGPLTNVPV